MLLVIKTNMARIPYPWGLLPMEQINDVINKNVYRYLEVKNTTSPQPLPNGSVSGAANDFVTK